MGSLDLENRIEKSLFWNYSQQKTEAWLIGLVFFLNYLIETCLYRMYFTVNGEKIMKIKWEEVILINTKTAFRKIVKKELLPKLIIWEIKASDIYRAGSNYFYWFCKTLIMSLKI